MKSRLLSTLEEVCRNPPSASAFYRAKAKAASHYGKLGELDRAKSMLAEIRCERSAMSDATVVSLVNFAEGLIEFRSGDAARGVDKWSRARALALSSGFAEGASIAAAWLAFDAYLREDLEAVERHLTAALTEGRETNPLAVSRATMILALYFHYCDGQARARKYYELSRRSSNACGDEVEVSALMHNMSAMVIHQRRVISLSEFSAVTATAIPLANLESADSYEELIGIKSLRSLSPQLGAYEAVLGGRWSMAVTLVDKSLASVEADGYSRLVPGLLAERALCHLMLHDQSAAVRDLEQSLAARSSGTLHRDDEAIFHSRLAQVYGLLGNADVAARHGQLARSSWGKVMEFQTEIRAIVGSIDEMFQANVNGHGQ